MKRVLVGVLISFFMIIGLVYAAVSLVSVKPTKAEVLNNTYVFNATVGNGLISIVNVSWYYYNATGNYLIGTVLNTTGNQTTFWNMTNITSRIPDGNYTLNITAYNITYTSTRPNETGFFVNDTNGSITFIVDNTQPVISLVNVTDGVLTLYDDYSELNGTRFLRNETITVAATIDDVFNYLISNITSSVRIYWNASSRPANTSHDFVNMTNITGDGRTRVYSGTIPAVAHASNVSFFIWVNESHVPARSPTHYGNYTGFNFTVGGGDPPVIYSYFPIDNPTINEGETQYFNISASDPNNGSLAYAWYSDNSFTGVTSNEYTYINNDYENSGINLIRVNVISFGSEVSQEWNLTINNVNRPPVIIPIEDREVNEVELLTFYINVTDPDNENGVINDNTDLTCSVIDMPEGATLDGCSTSNLSVVFSWTPTYYQSGQYNITFVVNDTEYQDEETFTIIVYNVPVTDLAINNESITFSNDEPKRDEIVTITAIFDQVLDIDPDEILVDFYDGDNLTNGVFIGSDTITRGGLLGSYFAQIEWQATEGDHDIYVYLDPYDDIFESDETNNVAFDSIFVEVLPDLVINQDDIGFTNPNPEHGEEISILAMVHNIESPPSGGFNVLFYLDIPTNVISVETLNVEGNSTELLIVPWTAVEGNHTIYVKVDSNNQVDEQDEFNNEAFKDIYVEEAPPFRILKQIMNNLSHLGT